MPILNSIKQLFSNFMLIWKLIVYYLICAVVIGLFYYFAVSPTVAPLVERILDTKILDKAYQAFAHYISMSPQLAASVNELNAAVRDVSGIFLEFNAEFVLAYVLLALLVVVGKFLILLKELPMVELIRERMTTRQKGFFTGLFIQNLGKSCIYALTTILFTLPFEIALGALTVLIMKMFIGWLGVFGIFAGIFVLVILLAAKSSLFSFCLPEANETKRPFKGVLDGIAASCKNFLRIFLYTVPFMLFVFFAVTAFTFFTFGAAIWLMIPAMVVLSAIFRQVLYFSAKRRNYYLDSNTIVKGRLDNDLPDMEEKTAPEEDDDPLE